MAGMGYGLLFQEKMLRFQLGTPKGFIGLHPGIKYISNVAFFINHNETQSKHIKLYLIIEPQVNIKKRRDIQMNTIRGTRDTSSKLHGQMPKPCFQKD